VATPAYKGQLAIGGLASIEPPACSWASLQNILEQPHPPAELEFDFSEAIEIVALARHLSTLFKLLIKSSGLQTTVQMDRFSQPASAGRRCHG
jgi:hypothetical protein